MGFSDEDEEVLFDQGSTILQNRGRRSKGWKIYMTFALFFGFLGLGLCIAIPGPTLLDLMKQTDSDVKQISTMFSARSVGYLFGSLVGGLLLEYVGLSGLLGAALFATAVSITWAPWVHKLAVLSGLMSTAGFSMGILDTGGNVMCLRVWGASSGPPMQALHFSFAFGAVAAPLLSQRFLETNDTVIHHVNGVGALHPGVIENSTNTRNRRDSQTSNSTFTNLSASTPLKTTIASPVLPKPKKPKSDGGSLPHKDGAASGANLRNSQITSKDDPQVPIPSPPPNIETSSPNEPSRNTNSSISQATSTIAVAQNSVTISTTTSLTSSTTSITSTTASTTTSTTSSTTTSTTITTSSTTSQTSSKTTSSSILSSKRSTLSSTLRQVSLTVSSVGVGSTVTNNLTSATTNSTDILTRIHDIAQQVYHASAVQHAYLIIGVCLLLASMLFIIHCYVSCCSRHGRLSAEPRSTAQSRGFRIQLLILLFFFYFFYVGMEVTYGGLVMTFSVRQAGWTKSQGALLTSVYWGFFAIGRLVAIPVSKCLSPVIMLILDLLLSILALAVLSALGGSSSAALWGGSAVLGLGMASIFPTGMSWAQRYMSVTGAAASVLVVGSALGEMALPAITGFLFQRFSPMWLMYALLICNGMTAFLFVIMQNAASAHKRSQRYGRLNEYDEDDLPNSPELALEVNGHFNHKPKLRLAGAENEALMEDSDEL